MEGYLGAIFEKCNCVWMAFSPPGTGFCGQLSANTLHQWAQRNQSSGVLDAFPAAIASGCVVPALPRIQTRTQQAACFAAVFEDFQGDLPEWRYAPQSISKNQMRLTPTEVADWATYCSLTIKQYVSAHDLTNLVESFTATKQLLVSFMEEKQVGSQTGIALSLVNRLSSDLFCYTIPTSVSLHSFRVPPWRLRRERCGCAL